MLRSISAVGTAGVRSFVRGQWRTAIVAAAAVLCAAGADAQAQGQMGRPLPQVAAPSIDEFGWYVTGGAGLALFDDLDFDDSALGRIELKPETGFAMGGAVGFRFNRAFRAEGEASYGFLSLRNAEQSGTAFAVDGSFHVVTVLGNLYVDFGRGRLRPYLGVGGGFGVIEGADVKINGIAPAEMSGSAFAWQLIAGAAYQLEEKIDLTADYRFVNLGEVDTDGTAAGGSGKILSGGSHRFMIGARYHF